MIGFSLRAASVAGLVVLGLAHASVAVANEPARYEGHVRDAGGTPIALQVELKNGQPYNLERAISDPLTLHCRGEGRSISRELDVAPSSPPGIASTFGRNGPFSVTYSQEGSGLVPHVVWREHIEGRIGRKRAHGVLRFDALGGRCTTHRLRWTATRRD